jgi:hypothetical protein
MFPIAFGVQACIPFMFGDPWRNLDHADTFSIMMWMLPMLVAMTWFTPELSGISPGTCVQAKQNFQGFSPDFLLTRAIDRPMVFRARGALFWIVVLLPAIVLLALAAWKPAISIEVPLQPPGAGAVYLETLTGASITKTNKTTEVITSPTGRLVIAGTMGLLSIVFASFWQGFFFAIQGLKFKRWIFFAVVVAAIGSPFLMIVGVGRSHSLENLIFLILRHPIAAVGLTGLGVAAAWVFSAARAKTIEYP